MTVQKSQRFFLFIYDEKTRETRIVIKTNMEKSHITLGEDTINVVVKIVHNSCRFI